MHSTAKDPQETPPAYREHHSVTGVKTDAPPTSVFQVLSVQSVVWDDSSLGCPQPERAYLPAQTPGLRVVFGYQGKPYQYHASERGNFVYCEHPAVSGLDEK